MQQGACSNLDYDSKIFQIFLFSLFIFGCKMLRDLILQIKIILFVDKINCFYSHFNSGVKILFIGVKIPIYL